MTPAEGKIGAVIDAVDAYADGARAENPRAALSRVTGQTIVFVETKVHAERLAGALAVAYEVRVKKVFFFFFFSVFFFGSFSRNRRGTNAAAVDDDLSSS